MPRSAALQMFEQKFRPFTILRCDDALACAGERARGAKTSGRRKTQAARRAKDMKSSEDPEDRTKVAC